MSKRASLFWNGVILIFGAMFFYAAIDSFRSNSTNWPSIDGKVSHVELSSSTDSLEVRLEAVTYNFIVNNKSYSNTTNTDKGKYHVEDSLPVYYNPSDPTSSELSHGESFLFAFIELPLGILAMLYGLWKIIKKLAPGRPHS